MSNPDENNTRRRLWPIALVLLAAGITALVLVRRGGAGNRDVDSSLVTKVRRAELAIDVIETGKIQPREKIELKSKVAGQVERVFVDEGERVKKGQLLLRLDATDFRRELARAEADVAQAKNALEFARLTFDRKEKALADRGVAQAEVDFARNDVKTRTVALTTAEVARGAAEDRLRYTQITSPIDGTVIQRGIQPGEVVTPGIQATFEGKPLLTIADLSTLIVKVDLNQIDVARVHLDQTVTLTLDALPGAKYAAKVTKISPASIVPKGRDVEVFPVEATLEKADDRIRPGMTADVRIHIETRPALLLVPIEAVLKEGGKHYVTRVTRPAGGKSVTTRVEVLVGARNDRDLEISSGVKEGEELLIKPASSEANEYKM